MQVLFYPFEEKFHIPPLPIKFSYGESLVTRMVRNEAIHVSRGEIFIHNHTELIWIFFHGYLFAQADNLVTDHSCLQVNPSRRNNLILHVIFCPGHKERAILMDVVEEPEEVNISLIHQIDSAHIDAHLIHCIHIMYGCFCKMDEDRDVASQVNLCMHLYTSLILTELSPWTKLETETDGAAVESINHIVNIKPELVFRVKRSDFLDEDLSQLGINMPVPILVGFCQRVSRNRITNAAVIQLSDYSQRIQARFDITQATLICILSHAHNKKLIVAGKVPNTIITLILGDYFVKISTRYELHNLSEDCLSEIHVVRYLKGNVKLTHSNRVQEIQDIYY